MPLTSCSSNWGRRKRRLWDDDEKHRIVAQTQVPGVSVSQVARRYDVNANLVFKWLRDPRFKPTPIEASTAPFLPVEVVAAPPVIDPPVIEPSLPLSPRRRAVAGGRCASQVASARFFSGSE